jgi:transposase InsO family protein
MMQPTQPPRRMRYSIESRCKMVGLMLGGMGPQAAAAACGASRATGYRLWRRYRHGGWAALADRRSVPRRQPRRLSADMEREILMLRHQTNAGPVVIAAICGRPASTVGKVLRRWGCSRLPRAERDPVVRYERERPGELIHVDTKKLGRFHVVGKRILKDDVKRNRNAGWQHLHVAIDDHTRLAYAEVLAGQDKDACAGFLRRAVAWYADHDIRAERVLSDNAKAYHSHLWRDTCAELGVKRRYTRPYTPRTNGKAEALIKTMLHEWAYRHPYPSSHHRSRALAGWLRWYNRRRPHGSLAGRPPISRVSHLCGQYT